MLGLVMYIGTLEEADPGMRKILIGLFSTPLRHRRQERGYMDIIGTSSPSAWQ